MQFVTRARGTAVLLTAPLFLAKPRYLVKQTLLRSRTMAATSGQLAPGSAPVADPIAVLADAGSSSGPARNPQRQRWSRQRFSNRWIAALAVASLLAGMVSMPVLGATSVPSAPRSIAATAGDAKASLTWQTPTSDGGSPIEGYNIFRNGAFVGSVGMVLTYTAGGLVNGTTYWFAISAFNAVGGGTHTANVSVTPVGGASSTTTFTDLPGWKLVFSDEFSTPIARGSFVSATAGRYFVNPNTWKDTSRNGTYSPEIIAVQNGVLDIAIATVNGVHKVAGFSPLPVGRLSSRGDLLGERVEFRIRADKMVGYKGVPLLWPMSKLTTDGEINFPESNFDILPKAYMHHQGATSGSDQDWYFTPAGTTWQAWHDYVIEWVPGVRCQFFLDGVSIGRSTSRVPKTAMHLNMQFETQVSGGAPDPSVSGHIQIDRLAVWAIP